jgi:hypothetical protein
MKAYQHLVRYALAQGNRISVYDGEEWPVRESTNAQEIIEHIESVEEAELIIKDPILFALLRPFPSPTLSYARPSPAIIPSSSKCQRS